jgi:hypothetical protein
MPNKFGDLIVNVRAKGDCKYKRLEYLTYIWYK